MKGFIYSGLIKMNELKEMLETLFKDDEDVFYIVSDLDKYKVKDGLPSEILSWGRVFSGIGEVRWERKGDKFFVILLKEKELDNSFSLRRSLEDFSVDKMEDFILVSLDASHINPPFKSYPRDAKKLEAYVYLRNGMSTFIRLRGFKK